MRQLLPPPPLQLHRRATLPSLALSPERRCSPHGTRAAPARLHTRCRSLPPLLTQGAKIDRNATRTPLPSARLQRHRGCKHDDPSPSKRPVRDEAAPVRLNGDGGRLSAGFACSA